MKAGKAEEALKHYDKAVAALPDEPGAHFDRGAALYALSRFDEAGQEFLRATEAKDGALKATAFYNLGNAFFKKDKFKEAVEAYKRTLALDPARRAREVERRDRAAKGEGGGKEEEGRRGQGQGQRQRQRRQKQRRQEQGQQKGRQEGPKEERRRQGQRQGQKGPEQERQGQGQGQGQTGPEGQAGPAEQDIRRAAPAAQADEQEMGAVLDSLERNPKDLEKERARLRAVRRRPPAKDW